MQERAKRLKKKWKICWLKQRQRLKNSRSQLRTINAANESTRLADERLLADVLALRDTLIAQHSLLNAAIAATHKDVDRYSQREIKWIAQIDVADRLQKQADDLSRKIREVNVTVQAANWHIEFRLRFLSAAGECKDLGETRRLKTSWSLM